MKKIIIAMVAIAAAFTMASCNKEQPVSPNEKPTAGKSVITASINNDLTKTTLEGNDTDGYKVFWSEGDKLIVESQDDIWYAEYTLDELSAGSSNGAFCWKEGDFFHSKTYSMPKFEVDWMYYASYPSTIIDFDDEGNFIGGAWKTEQTFTEMYIPMFAETECLEEGKADFEFKNLGGLLRLKVKGKANIRMIRISVAESISGAVSGFANFGDGPFAVMENGAPMTSNHITLDCGEGGVPLTDTGTDFYISMPTAHYTDKQGLITDGYSDVTITLTDIDGKTCVKKLSSDKKLVIERSKITTASFTASEFKANIPEGALPGKFTINEDGDQVYFSQGNLWYGPKTEGVSATFNFETNQYDISSSWDASHVSHFFWSKTASVAYAETYNESGTSTSDVLFTNAGVETAKADFTVSGMTGKYRTLSTAEWKYLFNNHAQKWITVCGITGYALAPDGVSADAISNSYSDDAAWKTAQDAGIIFLPAAGDREGSDIDDAGQYGYYLSSSAYSEYRAHFVIFDSEAVVPDDFESRLLGCSVRLVTDCE